ncbi:M73 family secreted endopeptidase [Halorhabdus sp. SVX81]|nr:M73 family secreted endopeptidase [Halorhabdus sp. SVX81]WEL20376.1 M73 family secreted endopeptidase [Halorhabdus sp. BNX81]
MDFDITLTRRRVLASILVIGLAAAAAGVGTFALFNDEAASNNNIAAGNLELDSVSGSFNVSGLYPTQSTDQSITTTYTAGVPADLSLEVDVTDDSSFSDQLDVESADLLVNGTSVGSFSGGSTLSQLAGSYDDVATLSSGEDVPVTLNANLTLGRDTDNSFQGDDVDITVTFNATQQT